MALFERRNLKLKLAALFVVVSGVLFWVGRNYRNQNIPIWQANVVGRRGYGRIDELAWLPGGSALWARSLTGTTFVLGAEGKFESSFTQRLGWGIGSNGGFFYYGKSSNRGVFYIEKQKVYEWKNGHDIPRPDLKLPSSDFEHRAYEFRSTSIDWNSQVALGADTRGPLTIWPLERRGKPITLTPPDLGKSGFPMPYDFTISPDRHLCVALYDLALTEHNKWPFAVDSNWPSALRGNVITRFSGARVVLFDLKAGTHKVVGTLKASDLVQPKMVYGNNEAHFSPSGHLFVVGQLNGYSNGYSDDEYRVYDAISGRLISHAHTSHRLTHPAFSDGGTRVAFSPDDTMLASVDTPTKANPIDSWVQIWSVETGALLQSFHCPVDCDAIAWSPDSHKLAVGGPNGYISVWDVTPFAPSKHT